MSGQRRSKKVKEINLIRIYQMGKAMPSSIVHLKPNLSGLEIWVYLTPLQNWAEAFLDETEGLRMPATHEALIRLRDSIAQARSRVFNKQGERYLTLEECQDIEDAFNDFEDQFEHDSRNLGIFGLTPKGDRDLRILIGDASRKFEPSLLAIMPQKIKDDLKEAGACLAFERPTACAFHVCRATEGLMRAYYKKLTGIDWPPPKMRPDWKVLVDQLEVNGAPKQIVNRLRELREDRNSFAHPDVVVRLDEAPIVYDLCTGVMFYIAQEMV